MFWLLSLEPFFVWAAKDVLLILFGSTLVGVVLGRGSDFLSRKLGIPRQGALFGIVLSFASVLGGGGALLAPNVAAQIDHLWTTVPAVVGQLRKEVMRYQWARELFEQTGTSDVLPPIQGMMSWVTGWASAAVSGLGTLLVISVLGIYIAVAPQTYRRGLLLLMPSRWQPRVGTFLTMAADALFWFTAGRALSMAVVGSLTALGLWSLGIPLALTMGLLAALLEFIPFLGPMLAAIPALLLGLTQSPAAALKVLILYLLIQGLESYVLSPLVQQRAVELPPVLLIAGILLAGPFLGILGIALATPLMAIILLAVRLFYIEDWSGQGARDAG